MENIIEFHGIYKRMVRRNSGWANVRKCAGNALAQMKKCSVQQNFKEV